jgi:predicted permease
MLTASGGVLGLALAYALLPALTAIGVDRFPRAGEVRIDTLVALVSLAAAIAVGVLMGLLSITRLFDTALGNSLRDDNRNGTSGQSTSRLRRALVAVEVGFAFVLLVGSGLLLSSFRNLMNVDPGFRTAGVFTASTNAPGLRYPGGSEQRALMNRTLTALRQLPGVAAVGATSTIPLSGVNNDSVILAEDYVMKPGESVVSPTRLEITPGFFPSMSIPVLRGRDFDERDHETAEPTIIVDERLARHFWPNRDPIGRRMYDVDNPNDMSPKANTRFFRVIGVVRSIRIGDLSKDQAIGTYYFPYAQRPQGGFTLTVKTLPNAPDPTQAVRAAIAAIDPQLALFDVRTMTERTELSLASRRTSMMLALAFGALALFLSAIGIYGVLAYLVTQRRREIGIRVALGSSAPQVVQLVLKEGAVLVGAGLTAGLIGAIAMQKAVANEIYGVKPLDPAVIALVIATLATISLAASILPARRALKVDPAIVLTE